MISRKMHLLFLFALACIFMTAAPGFAQEVCFSCHKRSSFQDKYTHQPVAAGKCTTCHNPHVAKHSGLLQEKVADLCFSCHREESVSYQQGFVHDPVRLGNCTVCHDPHSSGTSGLIKGGLVDSCLACHTNLQKKYKYTHQPYSQGKCSTCHTPHRADNAQMLKSPDGKLCRSCHSNTEIESSHTGYPVKIEGCLSCHNPHGSSQKALVRNIRHEPFAKGCGSCHESSQKTVSQRKCLQCHAEIEGELYASHSHLTDRSGNSCINCHNPHAGDTALLLKNQQTIVCRTCHEDTFKKHEKTLYVHLKTVKDCHNCHAVHGSSQLAMMIGDGNQICLKCHESQGQFSHPVGKGVTDPRNQQITTCVSCHTPHGSNFKGELKLSGQEKLCVQCHHM